MKTSNKYFMKLKLVLAAALVGLGLTACEKYKYEEVKGESQSKLMILLRDNLERLSRLGHFLMSRYSPTVVMLRPGTR